MSDVDVVVTLAAGQSPTPTRAFRRGEVMAPVGIGAGAPWRVHADGVLPTHLFLAFDGTYLFASAATAEAEVWVAGQRIGHGWTPVPDACEVRFGAAVLSVLPGAQAGAEVPPSSASEHTVHDGGALFAAAQRAMAEMPHLGGPPRPAGGPAGAPGGSPAAGAYGGPPAAGAYGGPPTAGAYGGPPAAGAYGGPPAAGAYGSPAAAGAYGGPPAAGAYTGPPAAGRPPSHAPPPADRAPLPAATPGAYAAGGASPSPSGAADGSRVGAAQLPAGDETRRAQRKVGFWQQASPAKKAILLLLPVVGVAVAFFPQDEEEPQGEAPAASAPRAPASSGASAATISGGASSAAAPSPAAEPQGDPSNDPAARTAGGEGDASPARDVNAEPSAEAPPPPPREEPRAARGAREPRDARTPERAALDTVAKGSFAEAARLYDDLAKAHPDDPTYREAARILRERLARRD